VSQVQELVKRRRILLSRPDIAGAEEPEVPFIRGVLGIWPWPILNVLLQFLYALRAAVSQPYRFGYFPRTATRRTEYIRDKEGRIIERYEEVQID